MVKGKACTVESFEKNEIYSRQINLSEIGKEGQQKLEKASVLVVGCGGLGAPVLYYLTAMGIGNIGLCDGDTVALSNLNRQILYTLKDIGKSKAKTAAKRIKALNPDLKIRIYDQYIDKNSAKKIIPNYDIVIDCLDNFETRFILNDICVKMKTPMIHAGVGEFYGQLMTIIPGKSPCLRCLFPGTVKKEKNNKKTNDQTDLTGIIGTTPGVIGAMQATEAMKYLLGLPTINTGLVTYDALELSTKKVEIKRSENCICRINKYKTNIK